MRVLDGRNRLEIANRLGIRDVMVQVLPAMSSNSLLHLYIDLHSGNLSLSSIETGLLVHILERQALLDAYWYNLLRIMLHQYLPDHSIKRLSMVSSMSHEARQVLHSFRALPKKVLTLLAYPTHLLNCFIKEAHLWGFNLNEVLIGIEYLYMGSLQRGIDPKTGLASLSEYAKTLATRGSPYREELKQWLERWRYPIRSSINDAISSKINLPKGTKVRWDKDLERRDIEVSFTINDIDQAKSLDKTLKQGFFTDLYNNFTYTMKV